MRVNLTNNATPQFRVLSEDQIERIFLASLEILEHTGTRVNAPEALPQSAIYHQVDEGGDELVGQRADLGRKGILNDAGVETAARGLH